MDPIPPWLRRFANIWDLRLLVLLSLTLQIILTLCGNRRKNTSSRWIRILVWLAYLMADSTATVALGKLSDTQYENGNALRAIWAPLLLLHLGGPDTITAYSLEDNYLWKRHLLGLGVQFSVALYVILLSWKHSWFSIMSIPALVAGLIKYGERTWALCSVSHNRFGENEPLLNVGRGSEDQPEDEKSLRALWIAQRFVKVFLRYAEFYDIENIPFILNKPLNLHDNTVLFWEAIEVEIGLVFDVLYTKAPINFTREGWILRCITFLCTMAVLIGLILQLTTTRQERLKVDIAITVMLLVGALAMEIYTTISLCLFSDWAMLWLNMHNIVRGKRVIRLMRKRFSWFFLPEQYRCRAIAQFNVLDYVLDDIEPGSEERRRGVRSLLGYLKDMFKMYPIKTAEIDPSDMCNPILYCRDYLHKPLPQLMKFVKAIEGDSIVDSFWTTFFQLPLYIQIFFLHVATELCYHLEESWADVSVINRDKTAATQALPSREDDMKLCIKLSRYMMYLVVMRPSLVPMPVSGNVLSSEFRDMKQDFEKRPSQSSGSMSMRERACREFLGEAHSSVPYPINIKNIVDQVRETSNEWRWHMLKWVWVKMLCDAAAEGQKRNEHFRQLSQGGEFITFLWFFLPPSAQLTDEGRRSEP